MKVLIQNNNLILYQNNGRCDMEYLEDDSRIRIIKETFPSEIVSIIGSIFAGVILTILILPFESFAVLILMVPAILSLRGNISGPFIARTGKDLIIGDFNINTWLENVLATFFLSLITSILIAIISYFINLLFLKVGELSFSLFIAILLISNFFSLSISIPTSTFLNYIAFQFGLNVNNVVNPLMAAIDDFFSVFTFYITLLLLGVP